jgi:hypothetical protein
MTGNLAPLPTHIVRPAELPVMARSLIVAGAVGGDGQIVLPLTRQMAGQMGLYLERSQVVVTHFEAVRALEKVAAERLAEAKRCEDAAVAKLARAQAELRKAIWLSAASLALCLISVAAWVLA